MKKKKLLLMIPILFIVMGMMSGCEKTKCPNPTETIGIIRCMPPPDNCSFGGYIPIIHVKKIKRK